MSKTSGGTRTKPNSNKPTGKDEFDGVLFKGADALWFRAYEGDTPTGQKEDKELWARIQQEMKDLGIPENIVGDVLVQISHGSIGDAGGLYHSGDYMIQVGIPKRDMSGSAKMMGGPGYAKEQQMKAGIKTFWHELGHAIHHAYYPKFSDNAVSGPIGSKAYDKAPNEEFARRFQQGIYGWRDNHSSFASYIRSVKKSVDDDIKSGKLTPLEEGKHEARMAKINGKQAMRKVTTRIGESPGWRVKKYRVIVGGNYKILAQNYIPK